MPSRQPRQADKLGVQIKAGLCAARVGNRVEAEQRLGMLLEEQPHNVADLLLAAGETLLASGFPAQVQQQSPAAAWALPRSGHGLTLVSW